MKQSCIVITLTMAFSIMLIAVAPLGSVSAQQQQSTPFDAVANTTGGGAGGNATGGGAGGNATGGGAGGNATGGGAAAGEPEIGTASELENLTQDNPEALTNNTEVTDPATGLADLSKEQTTTDPNMTTPSG
ncbi:MAG TPA: hypothetical protein VE524_02980 [Nitrososphaeraceae archaeon]|nr:hypothetical protein [Nitrososphaeraceae archaeon]